MVDQVTFPPSIGGSGKTYTNDANPQTGMFNGGHRVNFFPILADTVAAAGYVSRYAQAIDGAKANADKAEDAKGYVEAVADAYSVNILDAYRKKATVDLDFVRGEYFIDNGVSKKTNDVTQLFDFTRSTTKNTEGPDGYLKTDSINTLSRVWRLGVSKGFISERSSTNSLLFSNDFNNAYWNKQRVEIKTSLQVSPDGFSTAKEIYSNSTGISSLRLLQSFGAGVTSLYVKPIAGSKICFVNGGVDQATRFDLDGSGSVVFKETGIGRAGVEPMKHGWYRIFVEFLSPPSSDFKIFQLDSNQPVGSQVFAIWGAQYEEGEPRPTSFISTNGVAESRSPDVMGGLLTNQFSAKNFSFFIKFSISESGGSFDTVLNLSDGTEDNAIRVRKGQSSCLISFTFNGNPVYSAQQGEFDSDISLACSIQEGSVKVAFNGGAWFEFISVEDIPNVFKEIGIGYRGVTVGGQNSNSKIDSIIFLPISLSMIELQELTAQ